MIKIGIIGAGAIGSAHTGAISRNSECVLVAVCDLNIDKAKRLVEDTGARVYIDYKEMAEKEQLDAVILNLPHFLHRDVTVYFLERKVAVLVEKPMAITTEECNAMIAASEAYGTPLAIGHVQGYYSCYNKIKEYVQTGELGKLAHITETRNCDYFTKRPKWFLDKKTAGGGIIYNYGAHTLDKIRFVTGLEVVDIMAVGNNFLNNENVEAAAQMCLKYEGGVSAVCTYSAGLVPEQYDTYFYFTEGAAWVESGTWLHVSKKGAPYERVDLDYEYRLFDDQLGEFAKLIKGEESKIITGDYGKAIISVLESAVAQF